MESFSPIINQPEVAILGVNAIVDTPVVVNGQIVIRPLMNISLTADHRAVDGAVAAQFMQKIKAYVEKPALLLL
ncbi:Lipoamide acyltransferase component of branched-chain alpha-keto acid dehydrogenase complex [compost metagenome]